MRYVLSFVTSALLLAVSTSVPAEDIPKSDTPSAVELLQKLTNTAISKASRLLSISS